MTERQIVFVANDNLFMLSNLQLASDDSFVNDAVIEMTINDENGDPVAGETWPLILSYTGTDGQYSASVSEGAEFVDQGGYVAIIDAETPGGVTGHWEIAIGASTREC